MPDEQRSVCFQGRKTLIMNPHKIDHNILYLIQSKKFKEFAQ